MTSEMDTTRMRSPRITPPVTAVLALLAALAGVCALAGPPSGKKIIARVQDRYEQLETLRCRFRHEFVWAMADASERSEGTMELAGDDRFRYETDTQLIVSDGTTLWRYNRGSNQVIVENLADADPGALPRDFLFEFPRDFDVANVEEVEDDRYRLELTPKQEGLGVHDVRVWVDGDEWIATRLSFTDDAGNRTTYELTEIDTGVEIPTGRFQFQPPEDANVFDLR
ncbi:MAG: Outer-membrane lipoprotein carrier protein [Calditrichaeota bacterium]|nr:Outer-membrane lipoprotein carrier protein [Calditrichota bacterium]